MNLPALTIAVSRGDSLPGIPVVGRPGVRTHSALALMIGAAERSGSRAAALRALVTGLGRPDGLRDSREVLTPLPADPPSVIGAVTACTKLLRQGQHSGGTTRTASACALLQRRRHVVPNVPQIQATRPGDAAGDPETLVSEAAGGVRDDHSEVMAGGVMRASVGDVLVLPGSEGRTGLVIDVVGQDGAPPYVIKWHSDGHIAMVTPDPYSRIIRASGGSRPEDPPRMSSIQA